MSIAAIVRIGISATGFLIMGLTFYLHAVKKLTVNLAVAWEGIGIGLVLVGAIPVLSSWCYLIGEGTVVAMFLVGAVAIKCSNFIAVFEDTGACNAGFSIKSGE